MELIRRRPVLSSKLAISKFEISCQKKFGFSMNMGENGRHHISSSGAGGGWWILDFLDLMGDKDRCSNRGRGPAIFGPIELSRIF
jgi:hypothetical protein